MDNFGLFEDGDLGNLGLGGENFIPPQGTSVPVQEMDMSAYGQSSYSAEMAPSGNPRTKAPQATPQKMTLGNIPQAGQPNMGNYSPSNQSYHYSQGAAQQNAGHYVTNQYRQSYPGQIMFEQRPMQPNQNMNNWSNTPDTFSQVPNNYQQTTYQQNVMNSFPNQDVTTASSNNMVSNIAQNFQAVNPNSHGNIPPNYPSVPQSIPYQAVVRPPYANYDQQRPLGVNSHNVATYSNDGTSSQGAANQQYAVIQNTHQTYHIAQYPQNQIQMGHQQPHLPGQQVACGPRSQTDMSHSSSPIPNGTPYRAPFPQVSPQMVSHPQVSPMTRSMSPHTLPNPNLIMNSPVSSPGSLSSTHSPNGISSNSIQQLENIVKPNRSIIEPMSMNSPNNIATQQPHHTSDTFGTQSVLHNSSVQHPSLSSSVMNQTQLNSGNTIQVSNQWQQNRLMSPQSFIKSNNFNPRMMVPQRQQLPSLSQNVNTLGHDQFISESLVNNKASVSDSISAVGSINGPVTDLVLKESTTNTLQSESVNEVSNVTSTSCNNNTSSSLSYVNGRSVTNEQVASNIFSPNVPTSGLSSKVSAESLVLSTENQVSSNTVSNTTSKSSLSWNKKMLPVSSNPNNTLVSALTVHQSQTSVTLPTSTLAVVPPKLQGQNAFQKSFTAMPSTVANQVSSTVQPENSHSYSSISTSNQSDQSSDQCNSSEVNINSSNQKVEQNDCQSIIDQDSNDLISSNVEKVLKSTSSAFTDDEMDHDEKSESNVPTDNCKPMQLASDNSATNTTCEVSNNTITLSGTIPVVASGSLPQTLVTTIIPANIQAPIIGTAQIITGAPVLSIPSQPPMQNLRPIQPAITHSESQVTENSVNQVPLPICPQLNISKDILQCQQKIQELLKLPEDESNEEKVSELKEKLSKLEAQQKQQQDYFLQNQNLYSNQPSSEEKTGRKRNTKPRTPKEPKTPRTPKPKKEPKPKREVKPKTPKEPKPPREPKPKKEKAPKLPKEPKPIKPAKEKKTPAKRVRKKPTTTPTISTDPDGQPLAIGVGDESLLETGAQGDGIACTPSDPAKMTSGSTNSTPKMKSDKKSKAKGTSSKKKAKVNLNLKVKKKKSGSESDFSESEGISHNKSEIAAEDDENKRRSGRIQGSSRKKYVDELVLNLSDEEHTMETEKDNYEDPFANGSSQSYVMVNTFEEDTMPVQMILAMRVRDRDSLEKDAQKTDEGEKEKEKLKLKSPNKKKEIEEFYVKYKGLSYLHCAWKTEEELLKGDKRFSGKVKRYKQKRAASQNVMDFLAEEPFNPDYVEIDRILDVMEYKEENKVEKHYLVKWKSLPYDESTWELEEDCEEDKIETFYQYRELPGKADLKIKKRPKPDEWKELAESPIYKNNNQLRGYQLEGLNWLTFSYYNGHNCILADEMGLGKTIQSLSFVQACYNYGIRGPYLIIAPLSTIPNWQREFEGWTDLNVIVYHGSQSSRNMILEYDVFYKDEQRERIANVFKFHVLITTFEVIITDNSEIKDINWRICIIDEAHRLKNRNCKLLEGLRNMHLEHRVLLSGTPLQNNVNELFSLLNFLEPSQFSCQETFMQEFGKLESEEQVKKLQALLKPMMLRRMKEDVEKSLAPKEETIIEVELTSIQKKYYRAILERNFDFLIKGATYTNVPSLMNTMMELRKCCLHPYLLNGAEDGIQQDYKDYNPQATDIYHNALIQSSGKMVLVDKLLPRLKENGHRVLVFSQMVKLLDIIEDYLIYKQYPYERLDGRIRGNLRQAAIDRFCKPDSDRFVFLLCTKAGGLGINLTAADTVIIYDSDWNPQNDLQAQARCHRIGQQKCVKIYRLLCRNTYEKEMFDKASLKLGLDKAVLQSMNTEVKAAAGNSLGLSKKEVEDLLKKGAYGALMEDDHQGDKFCEEDIDQILSRRATVVTLESEKGSTFSKASFTSAETRDDIPLDDPDFWKKWAKKAEIDVDAADKQLIMDEPRKRSAIRRYGHDESVMDCSDLDTSASDSPTEQERLDDLTNEPGGRKMRRRKNRGKNAPKGSRRSGKSRWGNDDEPGDMDEVKYGQWHRSECFKVEKGLLTFGWGRWPEIMKWGEFRSAWDETHVQECARMILLYCIRYYRGDDKIKGFIFDLIAPTTDGKSRMHPNHIGLSAPVPRGRKGKKKLREAKLIASHIEGADWAKEEKFDSDVHLDQSYSRHLTRHANKVLLRVRLLFYIKQEIIGELSAQIDSGCHANELPIYPPPTELTPKPWWDNEADRNLIVGVYKHGYEHYNVIRNDPCLSFLARCGPPDKGALAAEMAGKTSSNDDDDGDRDDKDDMKEDSDSSQTIPPSPAISSVTNKSEEDNSKRENMSLLPFPSASEINGRLRRLVTSYQRTNKKLEMRKEASVRGFDHFMADKMMRRERMAEYLRERELRKSDYSQRRWSNREQAEFYRAISTFGVEYIRREKRYDWSKFRTLSRLEKRSDETLTEYFRAFMAMCKRQCGIRLTDQENSKIMEIGVDRLPEERARRVLERVDLLNRLRNDVLPNPQLHDALELALPSSDLPIWWIPGKHDLDMIRGVARHGLGRTDYFVLYDPDLCFREILRRHTAGEPLITTEEKAGLRRKYYKDSKEDEEEENTTTIATEEKDDVNKQTDLKGSNTEDKSDATSQNNDEKICETSTGGEVDKEETNTEENIPVNMSKESHENDETKETENCPSSDGEKQEKMEVDDNKTSEATMETVKEETPKEEGDESKEQRNDPEKMGQQSINDTDNSESASTNVLETDVKPKEELLEESPVVSLSVKKESESTADVKDESIGTKLKEEAKELDEEKVIEENMDVDKKEIKDEEKVFESGKGNIREEDPTESGQSLSNINEGKIASTASQVHSPFANLPLPSLKGIQTPPPPPLLSLQQMDEAMSKLDAGAHIDSLGISEPTVAQLLQQSAANPIKWPKDRVLQTRLEHIMYAVEHNKWPVPIDFQSVDYESLSGGSKCDTPPSAPSTPTSHHHQHAHEQMFMMEAERKRRRHLEEVERAQLQAMLHPNLHHNLGLSKVQAALGLTAGSYSPSLRNILESSDHDKKAQQILSDSHNYAIRQLQALQGSLDLTIKPVSSQTMDIPTSHFLPKRGPGRPRLDENVFRSDKRRHMDSAHNKPQDRKRRKLNDIVLGLSSKTGKLPDACDITIKEGSSTVPLFKGSSITFLNSKEKTHVTPAHNTPKLSSSISITPTNLSKLIGEPKIDSRTTPSSSSSKSTERNTSSIKPGLVKSSDLPPGINLPPGIELYRPSDSTKVDKWLEQHQDLLADSKSSPKESKRRKIDFSTLDWSKFSGDERVPVVNTATGSKLHTSEGPKLKYLAQWLMEHPGYDVDPRWIEGNKDVLSRFANSPVAERHGSMSDKRGSSSRHHSASPSTSSSSKQADPRQLLQGLDLKNPMTLAALSTMDPKLLAGLDPKLLFGTVDPKSYASSDLTKNLPALDPKILVSMGIDPKLIGLDSVSRHPEPKLDKKPSPAPSPSSTKSNESKASTSHLSDQKMHALDPKLLAGLDPKVLQSLDPKLLGFDPKLLAGLDPKTFTGVDPNKILGLDPKQFLGGIDPKLLGGLDPKLLAGLGGGLDPKLLAGLGGLDPMMMMAAGFGGLPTMASLGLGNPLLAGLPGFNLPGQMPNLSSSSKSKDGQRNAAAAAAAAALAANQANLFSGMFGSAAAGLMYPPLGLGGLNPFQLSPQMSAAQTSTLLNGFPPPPPATTVTAGTSRNQSTYSKRQTEKERLRQEAEREREIVAARKEKIKESMKGGGMPKDERNTASQAKSERLARVDPRTTVQSHEILLANHLSQLSSMGQIDLTVRPVLPATSSPTSEKETSESAVSPASSPQKNVANPARSKTPSSNNSRTEEKQEHNEGETETPEANKSS